MNKQKHLEFVADIKAVGDEGEGVFEGYGSVFGVVDSYNDIVVKGAFEDSLKEYGMPKLLLQHSTWMVGGKWLEAREDEKGLWLKGQLNLEVQSAREVYALMKQGAINGLSIGYRTVEETINRETGENIIKKVRLYEVSIVTFPANEAATVTGVKNAPATVREFEKFLREAGYSKEEAKIIVSKGYNALETRREDGDAALALDALQGALDQLRKSLPNVRHGEAYAARD
jgi:HK97 family phage prohead protease